MPGKIASSVQNYKLENRAGGVVIQLMGAVGVSPFQGTLIVMPLRANEHYL